MLPSVDCSLLLFFSIRSFPRNTDPTLFFMLLIIVGLWFIIEESSKLCLTMT